MLIRYQETMKNYFKFIPPFLTIVLLFFLEFTMDIDFKSSDYINIILVFLTYFYVVLTWEMVKNIKDESHLEKRPYIIYDIWSENSWMYFQVENIGKTLAKDFNLEIIPDIDIIRNYTLNSPIFENTIPYFPPKKKIKTFIGSKSEFFEKNPDSYVIKLTYSDQFGKIYDESYEFDISHIKNELYIVNKTTHDLVKTTEKLTKAVEKIEAKII